MTPREMDAHVEAFKWREDQEWKKTAWQTAWIVNHWREERERLSVEDILPKRKKATQERREPMSDQQMADNMLAWAISLGAEDKRKGAAT